MDSEEMKIRERMSKSKSLAEYNDHASEYQAHRLKTKAAENTEMQRRSRLTQEERSREAIERTAQSIKTHDTQLIQAGRKEGERTYDDCRRQAEEIADKAERRK
jgi:hypothetical protein